MVNQAYRGYIPFMFKEEQVIPKPLLHKAILEGSYDIFGSPDQMAPVEDQFQSLCLPDRREESEVHMLWSDTPCFSTCWNDGKLSDGHPHRKIEFILIQHPWMENDCLFGDIILPSNTIFEEDDIGTDNSAPSTTRSIWRKRPLNRAAKP